MNLAVALDLHFESARQRIGHRHPDAMQAA